MITQQEIQPAWFESWFGSPYYQALYRHRNDREAAQFVNTLIRYLNPSSESRVLDIACGEGRFSIQLAAAGLDVTGIDISMASIEKAREQEHDRLRFMVHDMRIPFYINYFDYAFNFFTSFGYFAMDKDHRNAARAFATGLKPGGILVMDYLNKAFSAAGMVATETIVSDPYVFHINRHLTDGYFHKDIRFKDEKGIDRRFTEKVAAFSEGDMVALFSSAGLIPVAAFGDYELNDYDPQESPRMILIFKKQPE